MQEPGDAENSNPFSPYVQLKINKFRESDMELLFVTICGLSITTANPFLRSKELSSREPNRDFDDGHPDNGGLEIVELVVSG